MEKPRPSMGVVAAGTRRAMELLIAMESIVGLGKNEREEEVL